ncbi:MAG: hypothetical protein L0Z50_12485 [Verrucomicrobiales bacterium]|nr:hypothetical protein [Verrucomicrobiales bacterium]
MEQITSFLKAAASQIASLGDFADPPVLTLQIPRAIAQEGNWPFVVDRATFGQRKAPGEIQLAISDILQHHAALEEGLKEYDKLLKDIDAKAKTLKMTYNLNAEQIKVLNQRNQRVENLNDRILDHQRAEIGYRRAGSVARDVAQVLFTDAGANAALNWGSKFDIIAGSVALLGAQGFESGADSELAYQLQKETWKEEAGLQAEVELQVLDQRKEVRGIVEELESMVRELPPREVALQNQVEVLNQAVGQYRAKLQEGQRLIDELIAYRRRFSGEVAENRYRDMTFRIFRNDAIQKYRAAFDLAARYVFLAAMTYDYETTFLRTDTAAGQHFLTEIIRQRALGEFIDAEPIPGRHGLGDSLARLEHNWLVLKNQLGITNPENEDSFFSLRKEFFRIDPAAADSDTVWQNTLQQHVVNNLWDLPEFRRYCRAFAPEQAGNPQPGLVINFPSTVAFGLNYFGWPLGAEDSAYDATRFATKIRSSGILFENYPGTELAATPRVYLIPVGTDILRAARGGPQDLRNFKIVDQRIPIPFPIGESDLHNPAWIPKNESVSGAFTDIRRYSSFHAYAGDSDAFDPAASTESRLIGRSVWNTQWVLIIPGGTLLADANTGLSTFINSVSDITVFFQTYSASGN